ncbi:hypothetical protein EUGRSUZ_C01855 [Eucalyptus grandis]|uniref:Uncharacterized protein n=2 Tax=Eucalyptus grandis TaxID=71139 RepID=A0A059CRE8_EUCGR|nr:hypothetical protein EUGRSUZ_C01855 [Eucalyptus grandis]
MACRSSFLIVQTWSFAILRRFEHDNEVSGPNRFNNNCIFYHVALPSLAIIIILSLRIYTSLASPFYALGCPYNIKHYLSLQANP